MRWSQMLGIVASRPAITLTGGWPTASSWKHFAGRHIESAHLPTFLRDANVPAPSCARLPARKALDLDVDHAGFTSDALYSLKKYWAALTSDGDEVQHGRWHVRLD
jgi:hypothetical protein